MRLKPDEQFNTIAQRIGAVKDPTARSAAALQIFGKSGTALLPMIKDLRALTQQAKDFDQIWTADEAKQADALGDSISLLNQVIKRNVTLVGAALAPSFEAWNMQMARLSKTIGQFIKANQSLIVTISTVGFALVAAGTAIVTLGTVIFGMGQIIGVVSGTISVLYGVLGFILSPIGLVLVAVAGLTAAFLLYTETGQKMVASLKGGFADLLTVGQQTFKGMADALKAGDIALVAEILWAGIKLEFIKGSQFVMGVWTDFTADITREMMVLNTDLSSLWIDLWAGMETIGTKAARKLSGILGMIFPDDPRISAQQEAAGWQKSLDDIEKNRKGAQGVLSSDLEAAAAERNKGDQARQDAARQELKTAQAAFDQLRGQAAAEAGGAEATGEGGMGGAPVKGGEAMTPESLDEGMAGAKRAVDVKGSFSAAAVAGMGAGSTIEKVAKDHLDESKRNQKPWRKSRKTHKKLLFFRINQSGIRSVRGLVFYGVLRLTSWLVFPVI